MKNDDSLSDFDPLTFRNEEDVKRTTEEILEVIQKIGTKDEKSHRDMIKTILGRLHDTIDSEAPTKIKFYCVLMLREATVKSLNSKSKQGKHAKLFSSLLNHKLLTLYKTLAENIDPKKPVQEKGKKQFLDDPQNGNNFIRAILQSIKFWAAKYSKTAAQKPTNFKIYYDELCRAGVVMPNELKYFPPPPLNQTQADSSPSIERREPTLESSRPPVSKLAADINHTYNKFEQFIALLEECDDEPTLFNEINNIHQMTEKESIRYGKIGNEVINSDDQKLNNIFFNLTQLMAKEIQLYSKFIADNKDLSTYMTEMKLQAEKNFPEFFQDNKTPKEQQKFKTNQTPSMNNQKVSSIKNQAENNDAIKDVIKYFTRLQERSKSPSGGFKKINQNLSRDKQVLARKGLRRSISPLSKSKTNLMKSTTSLKESRISPLFSKPPNPNPPPKRYEGTTIDQNKALFTQLQQISKAQGIRRFKMANFKSKSSLFQNEHIQVGYKSEQIYEPVGNFQTMMKIELFIGNLTDEQIRNFSIEFKGDNSLLLYANPKVIDMTITKGFQNKQDLMIVPLKVPFPFIKMKFKYNIAGQNHECHVLVPNSVLKLARYMNISSSQFYEQWASANIIKSREFRLCHHISPDSFARLFGDSFGKLTTYESFAANGSITDYEIYCHLVMLERHEAALKINVRPNLNVMIQLGVLENNEEAQKYSQFYLQTLEQILKEVS